MQVAVTWCHTVGVYSRSDSHSHTAHCNHSHNLSTGTAESRVIISNGIHMRLCSSSTSLTWVIAVWSLQMKLDTVDFRLLLPLWKNKSNCPIKCKLYWSVTEQGKFYWSVPFCYFPQWDKQPEIYCSLKRLYTLSSHSALSSGFDCQSVLLGLLKPVFLWLTMDTDSDVSASFIVGI